jgi:hypothetical protein
MRQPLSSRPSASDTALKRAPSSHAIKPPIMV